MYPEIAIIYYANLQFGDKIKNPEILFKDSINEKLPKGIYYIIFANYLNVEEKQYIENFLKNCDILEKKVFIRRKTWPCFPAEDGPYFPESMYIKCKKVK